MCSNESFDALVSKYDSTQDQLKNPAQSYLLGLKTYNSKLTMESRLNDAVVHLTDGESSSYLDFDWRLLRSEDVEELKNKLMQKGLSPSTIAVTMSAIRQVVRVAHEMKLVTSDEFMRIQRKSITEKKQSKVPYGCTLTLKEVRALFQTCDDDKYIDIRDRLILELLFLYGLACFEITGLMLCNVDFIGKTLTVSGRGGRQREIPLVEEALTSLERWGNIRGHHPGYLIYPISRHGKLKRNRISNHAIYMIFKRRCIEANLENYTVSDAKRTFAARLFDYSHDAKLVQSLMGHATLDSTVRYDRRNLDELAKQAVYSYKIGSSF
ncbi:tyrosine-type recombinase/integrase [Desulfuromonas acetoxidans]|uniref:tyrosine-type recombinase/integrase n=1 Tax=Desulfuromonas acetoxidans TaxID=891 RepID=UPI0029311162|nr:tyrosine-type recombinase/integrase [Desulfuromonas acetoxidans]